MSAERSDAIRASQPLQKAVEKPPAFPFALVNALRMKIAALLEPAEDELVELSPDERYFRRVSEKR